MFEDLEKVPSGLSIEKGLLEKLKVLAKMENRTTSNMTSVLIQEAIAAREKKTARVQKKAVNQ